MHMQSFFGESPVQIYIYLAKKYKIFIVYIIFKKILTKGNVTIKYFFPNNMNLHDL